MNLVHYDDVAFKGPPRLGALSPSGGGRLRV